MAFNLNNLPNATSSNKDDGFSLEKLLKTEITLFGESFSTKKKQAFYFELALLLKAGITVKEALTLIAASLKKEQDKTLVKNILSDIVNGNSVSEALKRAKKFSEYEYYSLKIGEETGTVSVICQELGLFFQRKNEQRRIIVSALTYPAIVISTAFIVVFFMLTYVVPMFQDIFKQNNIELPYITRKIIRLSSMVTNFGLPFLILVIALPFILRYAKKYRKIKKVSDYITLKMPIAGNFVAKVYLSQFTQAVSLLVSSKVPLLNSVQMAHRMIQFIPLQEDLEKVEASILKGNSLSESLKLTSLFDSRIISLVKVAEETNQTEFVFKQLNEQYTNEVLSQSKTMSTVLEPMIILFVGIIVAVLLIAMYLPMFQLSTAIS
jgi:type II secretory pathway component PulF